MDSRRFGCRTRTKYTEHQIRTLEAAFEKNQYPDSLSLESLSVEVGVAMDKLNTWFQNRRSKFKRQAKGNHVEWMRKHVFRGVTGSEVSHVLSPPPPSKTWEPTTNLHYLPLDFSPINNALCLPRGGPESPVPSSGHRSPETITTPHPTDLSPGWPTFLPNVTQTSPTWPDSRHVSSDFLSSRAPPRLCSPPSSQNATRPRYMPVDFKLPRPVYSSMSRDQLRTERMDPSVLPCQTSSIVAHGQEYPGLSLEGSIALMVHRRSQGTASERSAPLMVHRRSQGTVSGRSATLMVDRTSQGTASGRTTPMLEDPTDPILFTGQSSPTGEHIFNTNLPQSAWSGTPGSSVYHYRARPTATYPSSIRQLSSPMMCHTPLYSPPLIYPNEDSIVRDAAALQDVPGGETDLHVDLVDNSVQ